MSVRAMDVVWRCSKARGLAKLLLLAIADCANDEGDQAFPSIGTLARKAGVDVRSVQRQIAELEQSGELQVARASGPCGTNLYSLRTFLAYHAKQADRGGKTPPRQPATPGTTPPRQDTTPGKSPPRQMVHGGGGTVPPKPSGEEPSVVLSLPRETVESGNGDGTEGTEATKMRRALPADIAGKDTSGELAGVWRDWEEHLEELGRPMTRRHRETVLMEIRKAGVPRAIAAIRFSLGKGARNIVWDHEGERMKAEGERLNGEGQRAGAGNRGGGESVYALRQRIEVATREIERIKADSRNRYVPEGEFASKLLPEKATEVRGLRDRIRGWEHEIVGGGAPRGAA
jgi:hypothetical protein